MANDDFEELRLALNLLYNLMPSLGFLGDGFREYCRTGPGRP